MCDGHVSPLLDGSSNSGSLEGLSTVVDSIRLSFVFKLLVKVVVARGWIDGSGYSSFPDAAYATTLHVGVEGVRFPVR